MSDEPHDSLLGGLADDLARGLADVDSAAEVVGPVAASVGEAPPRSAILEFSDTGRVESAEAAKRAVEILTAAGWLNSSQVWSLVLADRVASVGVQPIVVGRIPQSGVDIVVPDMLVSRVHCQFVVVDGRLIAEDLGSTNGLVVRRGGEFITVEPEGRLVMESDDVVTVNNEVVIGTVRATVTRS